MTLDYKTITEQDIRNAATYIPIGEKSEFVQYIGDNRCLQAFNISYGDDALPPMFREDHELKSRYMLTALLKMYLKQNVETLEDDEWLMTRDEYDRWCGGHLMNTIEHFKANKELRDKIYNMMADYKDLEKRVNLELYGRLNVMNDILLRAVQMLGSQITPDNLMSMSKTIEDMQGELKKELDRRQGIIDGTSPELAED